MGQKKIIQLTFVLLLTYGVQYIVGGKLDAQEGFIFEDPYKQIKAKENDLNRSIYFKKGSDKISKPDQSYLQDVAKFLSQNPDYEVYILAHAFEGKNNANDILISEKRSLEIARFLKIHFVNETQIQRLFFGNSKIDSPNRETTHDSFYRKAEIIIGKKP